MTIILATWEREVRRIEIPSQPKANYSQNPISKILSTKMC
jgi:hypothetical protein